jgi:hypothetical protein
MCSLRKLMGRQMVSLTMGRRGRLVGMGSNVVELGGAIVCTLRHIVFSFHSLDALFSCKACGNSLGFAGDISVGHMVHSAALGHLHEEGYR